MHHLSLHSTTSMASSARRSCCSGQMRALTPTHSSCHGRNVFQGFDRRNIAAKYAVDAENQVQTVQVQTVMSSRSFITCKPTDSVDRALELLVEHHVTGLPVLDDQGIVVGVVSDYDLLALDTFGSTSSMDMFPAAEQTWQAFKQVKKVIAKGTGKRVSDVMTCNPITVTPSTCLNEATSLLIKKGIRRMPVVDDTGRLVGLLSRRDVIKAALHARRGYCNLDEVVGLQASLE